MGEHYRGLGYRFAWDARNLRYRTADRLAAEPERKRRTKPWKPGPTLDQGRTGACTAFGTRHAYNATPHGHKASEWIQPYDLYRKIVLADGWAENDHEATGAIEGMQSGSSVLAACQVMRDLKVIDGYSWFDSSETAADFITWTEGSGLVIGTDWHQGMSEPDQGGVVRPSGRLLGGHLYFLTWYDASRGAFLMQQSWGTWGIAHPWYPAACPTGFAWLLGEDLNMLIQQRQGELAAWVEKRRRHLS